MGQSAVGSRNRERSVERCLRHTTHLSFPLRVRCSSLVELWEISNRASDPCEHDHLDLCQPEGPMSKDDSSPRAISPGMLGDGPLEPEERRC